MKTENNDLKKKGGRGKWWNGVQTYINVKLEKEVKKKNEWEKSLKEVKVHIGL